MFFIKIVLCIFIICLGVCMGQLMAKPYNNRIEHLQSVLTALMSLEAEMKYRLDPLSTLFYRVGSFSTGYTQNLFLEASSSLKEWTFQDFSVIWANTVEKTYETSSLTTKDKQVLSDIGLDLGKTHISGHDTMFSRTYTLLEQQIQEAKHEKETKGKLYKTLGTASGILIVILMV